MFTVYVKFMYLSFIDTVGIKWIERVYSGNNKDLQLGTRGLMASHKQVQRNKGEDRSFTDWGMLL